MRLTCLLWLACAHTGAALAQPLSFAPPSAATIEDAPPAVRKALQEASALESAPESADSTDKTFARAQFDRCSRFLDILRQNGLEIPIRHAANSAAIIDLPETHLDMVRAGIALYGLYPSDEVTKDRIRLIPAMTLKARVVQVKSVPAGFSVSYGMTFRTERPTTIATIPVGYADGYSRALSSRGRMLIREKAVPIAGRVCMDMTMVDAGEIPEVTVGDEVVIFGRQGAARLGAEEVAEMLGTISYEVVSALTARVPRVYVRGVKD
jgi:alanine racemase